MMHDDIPAAAQSPDAPPRRDRTEAVGSRLRQIFDDIAAEPLPEAFEDLLRRLG
ncbi:MAG: NepR family anti-sigma factor [Janthinobacterium lividum]